MKLKKNGWANESPYERFFDFIAPKADRYQILFDHMKALKLNFFSAKVAGNRHFFVFPQGHKLSRNASGLPFRGQSPVMLVAHYDRAMDSHGANDNSIAVFHLLKTAVILNQRGCNHWIIVFTDKEEVKAGEGIASQGASTLAKKLKIWELANCKIFIFDACGVGDTFIISSTTDNILSSNGAGTLKTKKLIRGLRDHAFAAARNLRLKKILLAPVPFSDDAGFLHGGLAAQTITTLPAAEAAVYGEFLRNNPGFTDTLIAGSAKNSVQRRSIPQTWRSLNTAADCHTRLTPQFFNQVVCFAAELIKMRSEE